jgi:hypothetical protein
MKSMGSAALASIVNITPENVWSSWSSVSTSTYGYQAENTIMTIKLSSQNKCNFQQAQRAKTRLKLSMQSKYRDEEDIYMFIDSIVRCLLTEECGHGPASTKGTMLQYTA